MTKNKEILFSCFVGDAAVFEHSHGQSIGHKDERTIEVSRLSFVRSFVSSTQQLQLSSTSLLIIYSPNLFVSSLKGLESETSARGREKNDLDLFVDASQDLLGHGLVGLAVEVLKLLGHVLAGVVLQVNVCRLCSEKGRKEESGSTRRGRSEAKEHLDGPPPDVQAHSRSRRTFGP